MNTFEINKIVGAGLTALLALIVIGHIGDTLISTDEGGHEPAQAHGEMAAKSAPEPKAAEPVTPLAVRLAQGDMAAGEKVFKKCGACHTAEEGGANKVGPNLWNIVGRAHASIADFAYSDAMKAQEGPWTLEKLDAFIADPKGAVPGTKMSLAGIGKPDQRGDLLLYLHSLSASPAPLPEPVATTSEAPKEEAAPAPAATAEAPAQDAAKAEGEAAAEAPADTAKSQEEPAKPEAAAEPAQEPTKPAEAQTASAGDPAAGEKVFRKCKACHTAEKGGPNRVGPNLYGIVGRPTASAADYSYSSAMTEHGGTWTEATLDTYLADPKAEVPGTKMAFVGLKKEADRLDVIAYLKSLAE
ncbi:MAG: cytochrome c family protein [Proteobacteria bacterium]|nr:cytochrome c family protein [Pseudomonadota bacterium]